jgi:RNA polymerase sigma factor (sigma-70 family)
MGTEPLTRFSVDVQRRGAHTSPPLLPALADVRIRTDESGEGCHVELVIGGAPTGELAAAVRAALSHAIGASVRLDGVTLANAAADEACEPAGCRLAYNDPAVRRVLAAVICVFHRDKLERCASRCLRGLPRETMWTPGDRVENALALLLSGDLAWRGSLDSVLRTLFTTIRNLSRNHRRFERKIEALSDREGALSREPAPSAHADRWSHRALLGEDVAAALAQLPEQQQVVAVGCLLHGDKASELAPTLGVAASTVRTHVERARASLKLALIAYEPSPSRDEHHGAAL